MSDQIDPISGRPLNVWRLSPPELTVAENGYVLRTYEPLSDQFRFQIAATADDVGVILREWADKVAADLRAAVEREIAKVVLR